MTQQDSNESNSLVGQPFPFLWDSDVEQKKYHVWSKLTAELRFQWRKPQTMFFSDTFREKHQVPSGKLQ